METQINEGIVNYFTTLGQICHLNNKEVEEVNDFSRYLMDIGYNSAKLSKVNHSIAALSIATKRPAEFFADMLFQDEIDKSEIDSALQSIGDFLEGYLKKK